MATEKWTSILMAQINEEIKRKMKSYAIKSIEKN